MFDGGGGFGTSGGGGFGGDMGAFGTSASGAGGFGAGGGAGDFASGVGGGGFGAGDRDTHFGGGGADGGSPAVGHANGHAKDFGRQLAVELSEEEEELWRQLRRKRDFEVRLVEKRAQLSDLRDRRRNVSMAHSEAMASVDYLKSEVGFAQEQEREIEHDIAMLKESNRILQFAFQQQQQAQQGAAGKAAARHDNRDSREILAEEKKRQESAQLQHEQIAHLRSHLEKLRAEKMKLQQRQQVLFDKQRSAEQDRNRLLGTLQDDRSSINEVRQERIRLWEERTKLERQMAQIVRDTQTNSANSNVGPSPQPPSSGVPGAQGGVRGRVNRDTPQAFSDGFGASTANAAGAGGSGGSAKPGWTGFGGESSGAGANTNPPPSGGVGGGFPGGAFGGSGGGSGTAPPPSVGDLASVGGGGGGGGGPGITEWADRMRDFRTGGSDGNVF